MLKEFKEFALKGNMLDMAVGIIIGTAFGGVIKSLVSDVIMPPIGLLVGNVDFSNLFLNLTDQDYESLKSAQEAGAATLNYGVFVNTLLNFVIVAFAVFLLIKAFNRMRRNEEVPPEDPTEKDCPHCQTKIPLKATRCPHCTSQLQAA